MTFRTEAPADHMTQSPATVKKIVCCVQQSEDFFDGKRKITMELTQFSEMKTQLVRCGQLARVSYQYPPACLSLGVYACLSAICRSFCLFACQVPSLYLCCDQILTFRLVMFSLPASSEDGEVQHHRTVLHSVL